MTIYVTPLLRIEEDSKLNAEEAYKSIKEGKMTYVPDEKTARATLKLLGASDNVATDRLVFAHTGRTLYPV